MPALVWNPVDFLDVLETVPLEGEYGISFTYRMARSNFVLEMAIFPLVGDVSILITCGQQEQPVLKMNLLDCPAARVVHDKRGTHIEFAGANAFTGRFDESSAAPFGFRLQVKPFVQIEPFSYPG